MNFINLSPQLTPSQDEDSSSLSWLGDLLDPHKAAIDYPRHQLNESTKLANPGRSLNRFPNLSKCITSTGHQQKESQGQNNLRNGIIINIQNPIELIDLQQVHQVPTSNRRSNEQHHQDAEDWRHLNQNVSAHQNQPDEEMVESPSFNIQNNPLSSRIFKNTSVPLFEQTLFKYSCNQEVVQPNKITCSQHKKSQQPAYQQIQQPFLYEPNEDYENIDLAPKRKILSKNLRLIKKRRAQLQLKQQNLTYSGNEVQDKENEVEQAFIEHEVRPMETAHAAGQLLNIPQIQEQQNHFPLQSKDNHIQNEDNSLPSPSQKRLTPREQRVALEFESLIKIVSHKNIDHDLKYRWELGTLRVWNDITEALRSNFFIFIKHSAKYKAKFEKYIPTNTRVKAEGLKKQLKMPHNIKAEKIRETKIRNKRIDLANLKKIFNQVQISKVISYQNQISQSDSSDIDQFSEYEPQSPIIESMIEDLVVRTNNHVIAKNKQAQPNRRQIKAMHELFIYKLNKASQQYDYVNNMNQIFSFNKKTPALSCLTSDGLGLRSNNLKVITRQTFYREMNEAKLMKQAIILSDQEQIQHEGQQATHRKLQ